MTCRQPDFLMNTLVSKITPSIGFPFAALVLLATASPATAHVAGSQTPNADGSFTYSYVIDNSAGSFDVAAWSLEFSFLAPDWNPLDLFSGGEVAVPNQDWFADSGIPITSASAQDFLALDPDADAAAGDILIGFSFTSRFLPGAIPFHEFSADGESISGMTIGPVQAVSVVPEGNGAFAAAALAGIMTCAAVAVPLRRRTALRS